MVRSWFANVSIQYKITALIVTVTLIAVSMTYATFMVYDNRVAKDQLVVKMTVLADVIGDNCVASLSFMDSEDAVRILTSLGAEPNIEEAALWDKDGELFALFSRNTGEELPTLRRAGSLYTKTHLIVVRPVRLNHENIGWIMLRTNLSHLIERRRQYSAIAIVLAFIALATATLLAARYQRVISNPILSLAETTRSVTEDRDYSVRANKIGNDEVGALIDAFNNMLSEIQRRDQDLRGAQKALRERAIELQLELTERQRAELEAAQMRRFLQNVIDSMPSMLIAVDADGIVTQWNLEAEKLTKISRHDALNRKIEDVFPFFADSADAIKAAIATDRVQKRERVVGLEGDQSRTRDVVIYPLRTNDAYGAVIRVDDVTDRVRMEELMTQTEKMMSIGGLAAGMAHEINNPLGIILQGAQNIKRRLSVTLPKNQEVADRINFSLGTLAEYLTERGILDFLDDIDDAGKRAASIVTNMLNFSRKSEADRSTSRIEDLLDTAVQLAANDYDLKKKYDFRGIQIVREYDDNVPGIPCIATKLEQVFLNLLKNAAHALGESHQGDLPNITLRTRLVQDHVRVEIEDNGPGMPESVRRRIFEPFFTTKEVGTGTGLGLSVSYFIVVDNHRGTIEVESAPGQGAKFVVSLPTSVV
ncbi:MAG: PAS domain-containing protein [Calditrichaeota bacterium]|nr:PAS domain-containing protein [Calditrichota bacterium]